MSSRKVRSDGRLYDELRAVSIDRGVSKYAEGSALIRWGDTMVHCTATVEDNVPSFMRGNGLGWVTAEYSMLPRATQERNRRNVQVGGVGGRCSEIQRLISRSLRGAVYLGSLGERTVLLDCDVLQASAGTRTASITAAFVCLVDALRVITATDGLAAIPLAAQVAAVSVGLVGGHKMLDLSYEEDTMAEVDCNVVMTSCGEFLEIQSAGEKRPFSRTDLDYMLKLADGGLKYLFKLQRATLELSSSEIGLFDGLASGEV